MLMMFTLVYFLLTVVFYKEPKDNTGLELAS